MSGTIRHSGWTKDTMQNANAQVVGYVGSSICNLFKLAPYLSEQGYDIQSLTQQVMGQLNDQLNPTPGITGGREASVADIGSQNVGVAQNSGLSQGLA